MTAEKTDGNKGGSLRLDTPGGVCLREDENGRLVVEPAAPRALALPVFTAIPVTGATGCESAVGGLLLLFDHNDPRTVGRIMRALREGVAIQVTPPYSDDKAKAPAP